MDQHRLAAEALGDPRRQVINVGVELSLHAAGERHHGHLESALRPQVLRNRADGLAARDRDHITIADGFQKMVGRGAADLL